MPIKIVNVNINDSYIGDFNILNVEKRINGHFKDLLLNRHKNKHLQSSFNKYGAINFVSEVIEECEEKYLDIREEYWINKFKSNYLLFMTYFNCFAK